MLFRSINPFYFSTYGSPGQFVVGAGGGGEVAGGPSNGGSRGGGPMGPAPLNRTGGDGWWPGGPSTSSSPGGNGGNAVQYTGSGGGGGQDGSGGSGAGGRVIIRYSDSFDLGFNETGQPIYALANGYRHYDFANTGSITF